ncbi:MAG: hypothetical protein ACD_79C01082G0003 [uncultured bacterium]|nr:MAG: hypothetical protein ACD_79C01082G0003 [uncultured bacterium]
MQKIILFVFCSLFLTLGYSENQKGAVNTFNWIGEQLTFKITWFGVYGGDAIVASRSLNYNGKAAIQFTGIVKSADWFSSIYYVEDRVDSIVEYSSLRPLKIIADYKEGKKYKRKSEYTFDYEKKKMTAIGDKKVKVLDLPDDFCEMFGAFFILRHLDFNKNEKITKVVSDGRKFYKVSAVKTDVVTLDSIIGEKECLEVKPSQVTLDLFGSAQEPDELSIFFTNDEKRIPLLAQGKIRIGSIMATLKKIEKVT